MSFLSAAGAAGSAIVRRVGAGIMVHGNEATVVAGEHGYERHTILQLDDRSVHARRHLALAAKSETVDELASDTGLSILECQDLVDQSAPDRPRAPRLSTIFGLLGAREHQSLAHDLGSQPYGWLPEPGSGQPSRPVP